MSKVVITVGTIASGKSTWAKNTAANYSNIVVVERDDLRRMLGVPPIGDTEQERKVTKVQRAVIAAALADGIDVIISDTNTDKGIRNNLARFAHEHGADAEIKVFDTALDVCIERNAARAQPIPEHVVIKKYQQLQSQLANGRLRAGVIKAPVVTPYEHDYSGNKQDIVVFDLDGTLAGHLRSPYDYSKVSTDYAIDDVVDICRALSNTYKILFVSGRPDSCREDTQAWLQSFLGISSFARGYELHMRKAGDERPDYIVKNEIYDNEIIPRYNVIMAYDDRDQVVRHIRAKGITVAQVAYGNF